MLFSPRFVTTVASLAAPRIVHALRIRGVTTAAAAAAATTATATATTRTTTRRNSASSNGGGGGEICVVSAALHFLEDKKRLLECLETEDYTAVDAGIGASVGGHVRHSLDHFEKLVTAAGAGGADPADPTAATTWGVAAEDDANGTVATAPVVRYDRRVRGGSIEKDPAAAIQVISSLLEQLQEMPRGPLLRAKRVAPTFMLGGGGGGKEEFEFESNLERELFFCCHHGTHHDAMIQLILRGMGEKGELALRQAGKGFGVAPSTVEFLRKQKEEEQEKEEERRRPKGGGGGLVSDN